MPHLLLAPLLPTAGHLPLSLSDVQSERLGYTISFSEFGGMDIEENWEKVRCC